MTVRFSVLIPTYNRLNYLPGLLDAWSLVEPPSSGFELVLADDGSDVSPEPIVRTYEDRLPLRLLRLPHRGVSPTRQSALEESKGEYVLITDDDCRPSAVLLRAYEEVLMHCPDRALGGPVVNLLVDNIYSETTQAITTYVTDAWNNTPAGAVFFTGSNILLEKAKLNSLGGFDRSWHCRTGEDRDLCRRWCEAGLKMEFVPQAVMGHAHQLNFRAFLRQHFHYGQGRWWSEHRRTKPRLGAPAWSGPSFYLKLLSYPFGKYPLAKALKMSLLTFCAQIATAMGTHEAKRSYRRG